MVWWNGLSRLARLAVIRTTENTLDRYGRYGDVSPADCYAVLIEPRPERSAR